MKLNDVGKFADECWMDIPKHFPNAVLHEHVVMPNHFHGIIELVTDAVVVGTSHGMSQQQQSNTNQFGKPIAGSLSVIINQYKSSVKRWCNKNGYGYFKWQSRFHDSIIRNEQSYHNISNYIKNNPANWNNNKYNKE